ncbi:hypothetical protein [Erythrobacter sp. YT30]|uniref:hypothetical protein n=1 Tax=Erythrobacter sp. YT30 TaxID=1735012 RepID=UPI00076D49BE|nr:hypothetical protein [Erythrobacter sp. YT30]KWV92880.1 hypothetical protein AUC45_01660 [Erythrobacter sp. YT30]
MRWYAVALIPIVALPGCSILFPEDWRDVAEDTDECVARMASTTSARDFRNAGIDSGTWVPTYTYDITKIDLDALQELTVAGSDKNAGRRNMTNTNETSTAVDQFMSQPVDEKGAFFLGKDPALYRVRGEPQQHDNIVRAGCEKQQDGMRLTAFSVTRYIPRLDPEIDTANDETSE